MKLSTGVRSIFSTLILLSLVLGMQACGGGGGTPNSAPTASSVSIVDDNGGALVVGDNLTGNYTYADANGDAEGSSTYRWLRGGVAISGAVSINYTLVAADIGQSISFEVTPIAATGTTTGSLVVSSAIVLNANPIGYYAGTLSTVVPSQTDISAKAIVDSDKFLMVHVDNTGSNTLLYKGTFTDITANTFTADVRIYRNGAFLRTASITNGSITEKSSMSGTLSGTGDYTSTSFSLTYDTTINARTPLVSSTFNDIWLEPTTTGTGIALGFDSTILGAFAFDNIAIVHDTLKGCILTSLGFVNVNSEQPGRIRNYTANLLSDSSCVNYTADFSLTGYITPFDSGTNDNRYLWITYNDDNFFAGELVKQ